MCSWLMDAGLVPHMVDALAVLVAILGVALRVVARRLARVERVEVERLEAEGKSVSLSSKARFRPWPGRRTSRPSTRPSSRPRGPRRPSTEA